ncbi:uncharacterized protein EAE97_002148 [Botrytis byssoidea]|uniref:Uncharacterized protein n=1 Tax=Botrytis byssoidea TaxID=139641 RepID=A0A9P5ISW8_9HELO|nr:uncharacterized protein EAE97_002148 [Botrytis byssoidea]KAF7950596.1 hypothetical protein EAE97_002148 [Botrytis byssoidea]
MFRKKLLRENHGIERSETRHKNPTGIHEVRSDAGTLECVFPCVSEFSVGFVSVVGNKWRVADSPRDIIAKSSSSSNLLLTRNFCANYHQSYQEVVSSDFEEMFISQRAGWKRKGMREEG